MRAETRCIGWASLWLAASACGASAPEASPAPGVLRWDATSQSVEAQIEAHLIKRELVASREEAGGQELVLLRYQGQRMPDFLVTVHTTKKKGVLVDSEPYMIVVRLRTFTSIHVDRVPVALEALNTFNGQWAYGAFFLEQEQQEIEGVWPIRVVDGYPLPLDAVYDAIVMLVHNWNQLYHVLIPPEPEQPAEEAAPIPDEGPISRSGKSPRAPAWRAPQIARTAPAPHR